MSLTNSLLIKHTKEIRQQYYVKKQLLQSYYDDVMSQYSLMKQGFIDYNVAAKTINQLFKEADELLLEIESLKKQLSALPHIKNKEEKKLERRLKSQGKYEKTNKKRVD
jgi:regulator of replication initiation timing